MHHMIDVHCQDLSNDILIASVMDPKKTCDWWLEFGLISYDLGFTLGERDQLWVNWQNIGGRNVLRYLQLALFLKVKAESNQSYLHFIVDKTNGQRENIGDRNVLRYLALSEF